MNENWKNESYHQTIIHKRRKKKNGIKMKWKQFKSVTIIRGTILFSAFGSVILCVGAHISHRVNQLYKIRDINTTRATLLDFTTPEIIFFLINKYRKLPNE